MSTVRPPNAVVRRLRMSVGCPVMDKFTGVHRITPVPPHGYPQVEHKLRKHDGCHDPLLMRTMRSVTWL